MSIEKIVAEAINNNPLRLKEAFDEEMNVRIRAALQEKYQEMTEAVDAEDLEEETEELVENDDEEEDEDEDHDDEDGDDDDDDEEMANEMKKLHASACSKTEMYGKMKEKYGCTREKFNELYASACSD